MKYTSQKQKPQEFAKTLLTWQHVSGLSNAILLAATHYEKSKFHPFWHGVLGSLKANGVNRRARRDARFRRKNKVAEEVSSGT